MKYYINMLLLLFSLPISAQWSEDFTDGNFTINPIWIGSTDSFEVFNNELHLNAPANSSESFLVTPSVGAIDGVWEFDVKLDFNTSSSNKALIYLMSDTTDLQMALRGYFVMVGNTTDEVSLYKQLGNSKTEIIDGVDGVTNSNSFSARVKVARNQIGQFDLWVDTTSNFTSYLHQGTVLDNEILSSAYFGFMCDYTATRSDKFWFDNIVVSTQEYVDLHPPNLLSYELPTLYSIKLQMNESLDSIFSLQGNNYVLNGGSTPWLVTYQNNELEMNFSTSFSSISLNELAMTLQDESGNQTDTTLKFLLSNNYPFQAVVLNEIYADETPSLGMPAYEFVELRNATQDTLIIEGWKLSDASDTVNLPTDTLLPEEHLVLCKTTAAPLYASFGKTLAVPNFPSLNNSGDVLSIYNKYGVVVDSVTYHPNWYQDQIDVLGNIKGQGGYSLERVEFSSSCASFYNWFPCLDSAGATPGRENSVWSHTFPPRFIEIESVTIENDTTIQVILTQELSEIHTQNVSIQDLDIEQVIQTAGKELYILLDTRLQTSESYLMVISNSYDCNGNLVPEFRSEFYWFEEIKQGDIVFNEVLFNPISGGSDYIEFYNKSPKTINLESCILLEYDVLSTNTVIESIELEDILVPPYSFITLTEDTSFVFDNYMVTNPTFMIETEIPNLNDDNSILVLKMEDGQNLDSLFYDKSWHLEVLDDDEGVSLERIDVMQSTNSLNNWQSAARSYGFGTPTATNSQVFQLEPAAELTINPELITPNQDGFKDYCLISYSSESPGEVVNLGIYNNQGIEVKLLAQNHSVGVSNTWKWDGTDNNFNKADIGIYVLLFEIFDVNGKTRQIKKTIVVGAKLN